MVGAQSTRQGNIKANSTPDNQTGLYQGQFYARQPDRVISRPVLRQTDLHSHLILHNNDDVAKGQRILLVHANSLHRNPRCKNARVQSRDMLQLTPQSTLQGRSRCTYIYSRYADTHVTFYSRDILHLTPQSALQECTCIKQRQATVYSGICVARMHTYTADMQWLTPESALQEYTCIQQRHA